MTLNRTSVDSMQHASCSIPSWIKPLVMGWQPGTLNRDGLYLSAKTLHQHPSFLDASKKFASNMLEAFEKHPPLNRLLRNEGQLAFAAFILMLHHSRDPEDPSSGATYSRMVEMFGLLGIGSPTLIKAIIALARLRGHVHYVATADRRLKVLEPTDRLIHVLRVWFCANLNAIESIEPLPMPSEEIALIPGLMEQTFTYSVQAYIHDRFILSENFPPVRAFMQRTHGYLVLMALIHSKYLGRDGQWYASVPVGDLANRLMLSRGSVRNFLNMAKSEGWLSQVGKGGHDVLLSNDFATMCDDWMSLEFAWMAGLAPMAFSRLRSMD